MKNLSLQARFIVPVSVFVIFVVLGGAVIFSSLENRRIEGEVSVAAKTNLQNVLQILGITDALVMEQTRGAMRLLIERGEALGTPSQGATVQVKDKSVPDLMLGSHPQANHFDLVDGLVKIAGGTATLFVKKGDDFVRVSTNVKRDGERAIGTVLDPKGKAIAAINQGKPFYGLVDILGNPFITGYEPIRDAQGQTIGIWYVGYKIDIAALKDVVERSRLLDSGFLAVIDAQNKVRFHSGHVTAEDVPKRLDDKGWVVTREEFPTWGFTVVAAHPEAEVRAIGRQRMIAIIVVGVITCVALIGMMFVLLRKMVLQPLGGEPSAATDIANRIAAGDLCVAIPLAAGDDKSMMAAISTMRDGLVNIVRNIHTGAAALNKAADNLSEMADQVANGVSKQNDATTAIAATLEEITVSIRHVASNASLANQKANSAGELSSEGNVTVNEAVVEMQRSADSVNQSAAMVEKLGEGSRQITTIVGVIKDIADQTNLLALNAAIEAARAGETGRGFAVVADEVRKLAERTAASTHEITAMIQDIRHSTSEAIAGIEEGASRVNGSVGKANQAGESMTRINESTVAVVQAVNEISDQLREQSTASEMIAQNIEQVAVMNEENNLAVKGIVDDARRLQDLAASLNQSVASFRV
ncbi:MAG: Cache 3/Cache 2 fusion domain-containing protein [Rhodocyclaceae bacterium]|nr:Cache 3/Cache 2 fusion domain-containing protein [Rhodocyclaceae bacterium]